MVVSNRQNSIEKAIRKVFPHASYGVYTYHLKQNFKTGFKSMEVHELFNDAAYTYRLAEFNFIFGQLQMISPRAAKYLVDASVH